MAYSTSNPPQILAPALGSKGPQIWSYEDTDVDSAINAGDYFSNGLELGMQIGDMLYHYDTTTPKGSVHFVVSFSGSAATTAFAAVA